MINLNKIIFGSIIVEVIIDSFGYLNFWGSEISPRTKWWNSTGWLFILLELTLVVIALVPSFEMFSYDAIMLAGVLSCAHIIVSFWD